MILLVRLLIRVLPPMAAAAAAIFRLDGDGFFPPPYRASRAATSAYQSASERQRGSFGRDNNEGSGKKWPELAQQQQGEEDGSQKSNDGSTTLIYTYNDPTTPLTMTESSSMVIDPITVPQEEAASSTNTRTTTSINGQMAVNSALVSPIPPLISPTIPLSRDAAPINAEGPYSELIDESVSLS